MQSLNGQQVHQHSVQWSAQQMHAVRTLSSTPSTNHLAGKFTKGRVNSGPVTKWLMTTGLLKRPCIVMDDFRLWPLKRCFGWLSTPLVHRTAFPLNRLPSKLIGLHEAVYHGGTVALFTVTFPFRTAGSICKLIVLFYHLVITSPYHRQICS